MPRVSVCVPTYNSAHFLPAALDSVLAQDFADFELVVCDNASTDDTPALCRRYAADPRFRCLRFDEQTNQAGNFNRCLDAAAGDYLTLLHADDFFFPGFLRERVRQLDADPGLACVCGAVQIVDVKGDPLQVSTRWPEDRVFTGTDFLEEVLLACIVSPPSLLARRECVLRAGRFRTDWTWGHDWEWSFRLAGQGGVLYAVTPLSAYRVHDGSGTAEVLNAAKNGAQEHRVLDAMLASPLLNGRDRRRLRRGAYAALARRHMYYAEQALLNGRRPVAAHNLRYAARADRTMTLRPTWWALWLGCAGPARLYKGFRGLRDRLRGAELAR